MKNFITLRWFSFQFFLFGLFLLSGCYSGNSEINMKEGVPRTFQPGLILQVELLSYGVIDENGIGGEWEYFSNISGYNLIKNAKTEIILDGKNSVELLSMAVEDDPKHDDIGKEKFKIEPEFFDLFEDGEYFHNAVVEVYEKYGKGAGNTALCQFKYRISLHTDSALITHKN